MKSIASLEVDAAVGLTERLKKEAIPFAVQTTSQEGGLDYCDIFVEDGYYDRACNVAEAWEEKRAARRLAGTALHAALHNLNMLARGALWEAFGSGKPIAA